MTTYAVNENGVTTRYTDYDFDSFCKYDGKYYGIKTDGLYLLGGGCDASVDLGDLNFGTSLEKRLVTAYVGGACELPLELTVSEVEKETSYTYPARAGGAQLNVQRFDLGKGLRANYFGLQLSNVDQAEFSIEAVEAAAIPTSRRI